jgi:foldase protein PrsA
VPSSDVAVVGDGSVPKSQWDAVLDLTKNTYKQAHRPFPQPGTAKLAELRSQVTNFLVLNSEYEQEAKKLDIKVSDKEVSDRIDQYKQQVYGNQPGQPKPTQKQLDERYQQALKQQGWTDDWLRFAYRLDILRTRLQQKVTDDVKVSDSEITSYYDKNKAQYTTPAQPESRQVRHILVKNNAKADQLYAQLQKNPGKFAALAKKYSIDTGSGANGGLLPGGALKGRLVQPFERVAFSIPSHTISKPVHTQYGWHIIEAMGPIKPALPPKQTPLSQVKEAIRQILLQNQRSKAAGDWQKKTIKDYCKKIAYAAGYEPAPGTDPCKPRSTSAAGQ